MSPFWRSGDASDLLLYLIGMACVGAVLLAIGVA